MSKLRTFAFAAAIAALPVLAGCSSSSTSPPPPPTNSFVYYTTYNSTIADAQLGVLNYPLTSTSPLVATLSGTAGNGLGPAGTLAVDSSGRLFVLNDQPTLTVGVFTPPLTATSTPTITLTLPAAFAGGGAEAIAFDSSGNLWVGDYTHNMIYEFNGPFTTSTTLVANITMASPAHPYQFAFDPSGNLWVALDQATLSIAEFVKGTGFTNATVATVFLDGLKDADSVVFDKAGNLYAGGDPANSPVKPALHFRPVNPSSLKPSVVEADGIGFWPPANQVNNGLPTIVNSTGLKTGFFSYQLTFDALGNLYDADCGTTPAVYVFPTATNAWSATLAPSVTYSDANITLGGCVGGVAVH